MTTSRDEHSAPSRDTPAVDDPPGRNKWLTTIIIAAVCSLAALGVGIVIGGRRAPAPPQVTPPTETGSRRVRMPAEVAERAGIRTVTVQAQTLAPTLNLLGSVDFDAERTAEVGGRISGRITQIYVRAGDEVRVGQPLAEIESSVLGEALASYLSSRARSIAARAQLARETALIQQQLSTARAVEEARANAAALDAEVRGGEQRLLAMGLSPADLHSVSNSAPRARHVTLRAPIAGRVIARTGVVGQTVEATSTILRVADLSELWVMLDVFERDLARVTVGAEAEIRSETYPGRVFRGTVNYVQSTIDAATRTARVRIEVRNEEYLLRPGQFVSARVRVGDATGRPVVSIPRSALVQLEGRPAGFVAVGPNLFEPRTLELGVVDGENVEVVRGLAAGDSLVVEGAFAIKSEMQR